MKWRYTDILLANCTHASFPHIGERGNIETCGEHFTMALPKGVEDGQATISNKILHGATVTLYIV
jgi:hypothetical protein